METEFTSNHLLVGHKVPLDVDGAHIDPGPFCDFIRHIHRLGVYIPGDFLIHMSERKPLIAEEIRNLIPTLFCKRTIKP